MLASSVRVSRVDVIGVALAVERLVAGIVRHRDQEHHAEQDQRRNQRARRRAAAAPVEPSILPLGVMTSV